jgi:hypothetical protein
MAVLQQLRSPKSANLFVSGMGYTAKQCDEGVPGGQPPPMAGQFWVSVHSVTKRDVQESSSEQEYTLQLTVSERIDVPFDRIGALTLQKGILGVNDRCDAIGAMMKNAEYTVMNLANTIINLDPNGPWDGFVEPLLLAPGSAESARIEDGTWFHAGAEKLAAAVQTMTFQHARRIQGIGNVA